MLSILLHYPFNGIMSIVTIENSECISTTFPKGVGPLFYSRPGLSVSRTKSRKLLIRTNLKTKVKRTFVKDSTKANVLQVEVVNMSINAMVAVNSDMVCTSAITKSNRERCRQLITHLVINQLFLNKAS